MTRYQIFNSAGNLVCQADLGCRYPAKLEMQLLDAGYRIYIDKKRLTRKDALQRCQKGGPDRKT